MITKLYKPIDIRKQRKYAVHKAPMITMFKPLTFLINYQRSQTSINQVLKQNHLKDSSYRELIA